MRPGTQKTRQARLAAMQALAEAVRLERLQLAMRETAAEWASRLEPNYFVTLTFASKDGVNFAYASTAFGRFVRHLRSAIYGPKSKKRLALFPVVEGQCLSNPSERKTGVHIHLLINLEGSQEQLMRLIARAWRKSGRFCGDPKKNDEKNNQWFKRINKEEETSYYSGYIVKTCRDNIDAVLLDFVHIPVLI